MQKRLDMIQYMLTVDGISFVTLVMSNLVHLFAGGILLHAKLRI